MILLICSPKVDWDECETNFNLGENYPSDNRNFSLGENCPSDNSSFDLGENVPSDNSKFINSALCA